MGVVLFRMLMTDEGNVKELVEVQRRARCEPME
jgi:hypothetical protein